MDSIFSQIKPRSIPKGIVQQIKDLISEGKLHPGEKLPSERSLSEIFGVGRSSLREAINTLETLGLVEKKNREGIFVRSLASPIISNPLIQMLEEDKTKFFDLYEIRKDIEIASAEMAARRRTDDDLLKLESIVHKMKESAGEKIVKRADDLEFHMAVAVCTKNLLRVHTLRNIFDLFGEFIAHIANKLNQENDNIAVNIDHHMKIFTAIRNQDPEKARTQMNEHLKWVEKIWRKSGMKKK